MKDKILNKICKILNIKREYKDICKCKKCGLEWSPYETEHFNMSFCMACHSTKIKWGYYVYR